MSYCEWTREEALRVITDNLIRLAVRIETVDDLIADLDQPLWAV